MDRLRQRADFLAVANGARVNSTAFTLQSRSRDDSGPIPGRIYRHQEERQRARAQPHPPPASRGGPAARCGLDSMAMRPHHDYVLVGRRAALTCDFSTMLDDLRSALNASTGKASNARPQKSQRARAATRIERRDPQRDHSMLDNRNTILAVILSGLVLIAWQYFYNIPQMEKQRAAQQAQAELQKKRRAPSLPTTARAANTPPQAGSAPARRPPAAARRVGPGGRPRHRDRGHPAHQDRDARASSAASR